MFLSFRLMECLAVLYHFFSNIHKLFNEIMPAEIVCKAVMSAWINQATDKENGCLEHLSDIVCRVAI